MQVVVFEPADADHVAQAFVIYERWRRAQGLPPTVRPEVRVAISWPPQDRTGRSRTARRVEESIAHDGPVPLLLNEADTAQLLGCSPRTVRRRAAEGKLHPVRDGRLKRYRRADVEAFAEALVGQES